MTWIWLLTISLAHQRHGSSRPIEAVVFFILNIGRESRPSFVPPPVFRAMRRNPKVKPPRSGRAREIRDHIPVRSHLGSIPVGELGVIHGKAVAMLRHRHNVLCPGTHEEIDPCIGIELLGAEERDEVLIAENRLRTVGGNMMLERRAARLIHTAGVPLIAKSRYRIDSPVEEDPELRITEPVRRTVARKRFPISVKHATCICRSNLCDLPFYPARIVRSKCLR